MSMIDGGIGCVRLKSLPNRQTHRWPLGASSSGVAHEGVPIALENIDRDRLISDVRRQGGVLCTLRGTLRFVPRDDLMETMFGPGIPQIYVEVDSAEPVAGPRSARKPVEVTAVVTFLSRGEQFPGLNATYVTFDAGGRGNLGAATRWLDEIYVRESYQGHILTDFDEQTRHFEQASFSLTKLLNGLVRKEDAEIDLDRYPSRLMKLLEGRGVFVAGDVHGDVYVGEHVAAMGPHAQSTSARFTIGGKRNDE
jgi:hypothetical protein